VGRRSRKRRHEGAVAQQAPRPPLPAARPPSRSEAKNAAAREKLEPLEPGERPLAVTIGAVVAAALALANIVLYAAGVKVAGQKPSVSGIAGPTLIMAVAAYGMWRARYWAVLGVEALLALIILIFSLLAVQAENVHSVLIAAAVIAAAGTLFWFLIKAMARIQMPERPRPR
jgi:hypothetical protein